MKNLIIYYSLSGNTKKAADIIQSVTNGTLAQIRTIKPYIGNYKDIVVSAQNEVRNRIMPPIYVPEINLDDYETIFLGTPVWWYSISPALNTFLHTYPLSGKSVFPFITGDGWWGHTMQIINKLCPGAHKGIEIQFDGSELITNQYEIIKWAKNAIQ